MEGLELVSFKIISAVGMAKSSYIEAMKFAQNGEFEKAEELLVEGQNSFNNGHSAHSELIQQEASGDKVMVSLLLMHAEDQMMSAETIKIMAQEIIKLSKKIEAIK